MKHNKLFLTLLLGCLLSIGMLTESNAQTYTGNLNLTTQAQVDAFNYTEVTGYLSIHQSNITNLDHLSSLTSLGGILSIYANPELTNLDGLSNLTSVGGYLFVSNNTLLANIDGLSGLTSVGGFLDFDTNPALTNIDGLSGLTSMENLSIYNNTSLTNIDALSGLTYVGALAIFNNPALTNIDGLSGLTSIGRNLRISSNSALTNLDGLRNVISVGETTQPFAYSVNITYNSSLNNFYGLYPLISEGTIVPALSGVTFTISGNASNPTEADILNNGPGTGNINGTVTSNSAALQGVKVALLDINGIPVTGVDTLTTDAQGAYSFTGVTVGNYIVTIIEPLGYSALENPKPSELSLDATDMVDFQLEQIVVGNSAKSVLFWTEEFRRNILGLGHTRYTEQELQGFIGLVQTHYTPHFDIFQGNTSLQDWLNDLKVWSNNSVYKQGRRQLAALVLNLVSGKIGQYSVVTRDNRTCGDLLTYVSQLLTDGDNSNDGLALSLVLRVNLRLRIRSGLIPSANILYKGGKAISFIDYGLEKPKEFALEQNYPNPFNPGTMIRYSLPENTKVRLVIYDILGKQVAELVNGEQAAGYHDVKFDGSSLASGIYFYRLTTDKFTKINKMMLLK